jgi:hypothetical protein
LLSKLFVLRVFPAEELILLPLFLFALRWKLLYGNKNSAGKIYLSQNNFLLFQPKKLKKTIKSIALNK